MKKMQLTSVSAVELVSALCLNLAIQTADRFVFGVIVPIPPHTQNIMCNNRNVFSIEVMGG